MVDKEKIYFFRHYVMPVASSWLANDTYGSVGEQDREDFEKDFNEILDLALIGLKYKAQLSLERTEKRTETRACDLISRQAAIGEVKKHYRAYDNDLLELITFDIEQLPPAQPEQLTDKEQRIFLAAMRRERKVCTYAHEPCEVPLTKVCDEIVRKVKGALWT